MGQALLFELTFTILWKKQLNQFLPESHYSCQFCLGSLVSVVLFRES